MKRADWIMAQARRSILTALLLLLAVASASAQITNTVHNLSATGPGAHAKTVNGGKHRAKSSEDLGVCIYCHTPHNARPTRALWNRALPAVTYRLYQSTTTKAQVVQPNGSSRLCLSCHDGILALSNVRVKPGERTIEYMPPLRGSASLGTDLSHDHPISFLYDSALALRDGQLADPALLPRTAPLDERKQLQCSSCHDPHMNTPNFLRMDERSDRSCTVCHRQHDWRTSSHSTANLSSHAAFQNISARAGENPASGNACLSCHKVHGAPHPQRLLAQTVEEKNCTVCHNGIVGGQNLDTEFVKPSNHPIHTRQWVHDPAENPLTMPRHVTCVDCHNPHAASATASASRSGLVLPGSLRGVSGITIGGAKIKEARYEYEICLKCHGIDQPARMGILRREAGNNIRQKIGPTSMSYHPIAMPARNPRMLGLLPPYTSSSVITCTDCHDNDQWVSGGRIPRGPHGSRFAPILAAEYDTLDPSPESYLSYALCYKCHDRGMILSGGRLNGFPHKKHVVDSRTSCAVCHDAHGSRQNAYLINFMTVSQQGTPLVGPAKNGRLAFVPTPGRSGHGKCYLTCHGTEHNGTAY